MNSDFVYKIIFVDEKSKWIHICSNGDYEEHDAFFSLLKQIAKQSGEKIKDIGDFRYTISNLPYDIVFQWDDLFGIVIEYKNAYDKKNILDYINANIIN